MQAKLRQQKVTQGLWLKNHTLFFFFAESCKDNVWFQNEPSRICLSWYLWLSSTGNQEENAVSTGAQCCWLMEAGLLQHCVASSGVFYIGAQLLCAQHSSQSHTGQISRVFSKWQFVLIKFWFFLFLIESWKRWSKMSKQSNNFVYFLAFLWILPFNKVTLLILCICATLQTTYSALPFMPWNFSYIQCWPFFFFKYSISFSKAH